MKISEVQQKQINEINSPETYKDAVKMICEQYLTDHTTPTGMSLWDRHNNQDGAKELLAKAKAAGQETADYTALIDDVIKKSGSGTLYKCLLQATNNLFEKMPSLKAEYEQSLKTTASVANS